MVMFGDVRLDFREHIEQEKRETKPAKPKRKLKTLYNVKYYYRAFYSDGSTCDYLIVDRETFAVSAKQAVNNVRFSYDVENYDYLTSQYEVYANDLFEYEFVWIVTNTETDVIEWDTKNEKVGVC